MRSCSCCDVCSSVAVSLPLIAADKMTRIFPWLWKVPLLPPSLRRLRHSLPRLCTSNNTTTPQTSKMSSEQNIPQFDAATQVSTRRDEGRLPCRALSSSCSCRHWTLLLTTGRAPRVHRRRVCSRGHQQLTFRQAKAKIQASVHELTDRCKFNTGRRCADDQVGRRALPVRSRPSSPSESSRAGEEWWRRRL